MIGNTSRLRPTAVTGFALLVLAAGGVAHAGLYDDAVLADNPFLYYRFEEAGGSGTAIDAAGGDQNGTYLGGVVLEQPSAMPDLGNSGQFLGTDERIDLPSLGSYSQHSIEMWINTNGLAGGCCTSLYSTDTWGTDGSGSSLHYNIKSGRDIEHAMNNGGPNNVNTPGGLIQDGNWYHVVSTYDATAGGATKIYVNGFLRADSAHTTGNNLNLTTGGEVAAWNVGRDFKGNIDEFAMYDSVLSETQVQAHYVAAIALPEMLSYWNFDSKSGTTIPDQIAGSTHDGTLIGGADITTGGQGVGGSGEAMVLGANGDYLDVADPTTYDFNSSFTWHAMVKTDDNSGAIFSRNPDGTAWNQGSKALFVRNRGGNGEVEWDSGWVANPRTNTAVNDDEWHQIIATFDESTDLLQIYVDGQLEFNGTHDANRFNEHTTNHNGGFADTSFTIGQADFSGGLSSLDALVGLIDDAALFDLALTDHALNVLIQQGPTAFLPAASGVPEPGSIVLMVLGLLGFAVYARRQRKA